MIRFVLALIVASALPVHAQQVKIATSPDFPPYVFTTNTGTISGFDHAVVSRICRTAKLDCVWVKLPFDRLLQGVARGDVDVAAGGISVSKARARKVAFSQPHIGASNRGWLVGLPTQNKPVATARIAVQAGTTHQAHLKGKKWRSVAFKTNEQAIQAVLSGQADYFFAAETFLRALLASKKTNLVFVAEERFASAGQAFAFPKRGKSYKAVFDREIARMKQDGSLARLRSKWLK